MSEALIYLSYGYWLPPSAYDTTAAYSIQNPIAQTGTDAGIYVPTDYSALDLGYPFLPNLVMARHDFGL